MQRQHDRRVIKNRDHFTGHEKRNRISSERSVGRHEVWSWKTASKESLCLMWQKVKVQLMLSMSFLTTLFWYCRRLYSFLAQLLKRWSNYLQRQLIRNLSVLPEVDLLGYSAREWKGETKQAKQMREAYEELFRSCHIKYLRQVRRDNYSVVRAVLFQIFSQGIPFPSWMKERDILKLPEKLLYSQGCNWIQQYSFGPERYTGPNAFGKLRKCMEALKTNWAELSATRDHEERGSMCNTLFSDESKEYKLYEAIKFIMLYEVVEAYEQIKSRGKPVHNLFSLLFARDSSSDPLSFMMNHLNSIGDSICLDQVELFLLGYLLEVKIRVYRLHRFNTEEFQVNYPDEYRREWNEISLLTEDDHYYHIPLFRT
ncbi:inactive ubiquitin thioesterase OTULINL isoform X1 [Onychostruthus taczanowskii]|uniref:inactive ubiquitin thioesterase OTULINL isoform X1 n=2 Tax=Onychostruthus taczanowskii TaxID=356909 RepID=UPI001B80476B|nr:inactive ubiquitin thioesterase OTULINL isoform X1 [Onychostruthus taczanowskii]